MNSITAKFRESFLSEWVVNLCLWFIAKCGHKTDVAIYGVANKRSVIVIDTQDGEAAMVMGNDDNLAMIFGANVTHNNFQRICAFSSIDSDARNIKPLENIINNGVDSGHIDRLNSVLGNMRGEKYPPLKPLAKNKLN